VGDLKQGQQLELIATMGEWLAGKVYLSASWCALVTEGQPDVPVPIADGFDAPIGSPQERAGWQLWPGACSTHALRHTLRCDRPLGDPYRGRSESAR